MSKRIQKEKQATEREFEPVEAPAKTEQPDLSDIDALLDEIDSVLEVNAEEFVKGYVQQGGE